MRIAELVGKFGANGLVTSICDSEFSPALSNVANEIVAYVNEPCIMGRVAKRAGTTRDDCTVTDNATGSAVPSCDEAAGAGPCWRLEAGGATCGGASVKVTPPGGGAAPLDTTVECTMCAPGTADPARGCRSLLTGLRRANVIARIGQLGWRSGRVTPRKSRAILGPLVA